ncbi:MAG TPA: DUF4062 domain-containing protein [Chthoniobacterales bacterium]|nr:DUF4062 domain-containing protein [Chthoniobacterales bacterium]
MPKFCRPHDNPAAPHLPACAQSRPDSRTNLHDFHPVMRSRRSVFISATSKGFGTWRKTIADLLIDHGIHPLEQTWLKPEKEIVRREIEVLVSSASGIICLIGPYYGYPLEKNSDGTPSLSYTQYEWWLATKWNKPRLVYLIEDSFFGHEILPEVDPRLPGSGQFRKWQADFREMIMTKETKYQHRPIGSPEALAMALAAIDWSNWPDG